MQIHLRSLAERLLREGTVSVPDLQGIDLNELIHELHVYHAELQIQHSELEAAQAEAERSRNEYAQLFHYAPVSILFVDQRGVIKEANQAAARQLGATHQGLRGKPLSLFLPASEHPRFFHSLRAVLGQQERLEFQTQCVRLGGDRFPAMCTMAWWPMSEIAHPMVSLSFHDLTETQRAEQALQKQAELQRQTTARIESLVNALPAHIAMLDAQGNIVAVNEAWKRFSCDNGLKIDNYCIGYNYLNVCASATGDNCEEAAEAAEAAAGIRAVLAGEVPEFVTEYPCHSPQEQRWFRLMVTPVLIDGTSRGAVVMHLNVTERKLAEAEKQRLIVDLNERVKELRGLHTAAFLLRESLPTQEVLSKIAAMLPGTLRFGHLAAARVCFGAECQATPNFCDTPWKLETTFSTAEGTLGRIEVVYLDSHSSSDPNNLFVPEERRILDSLAEMLRAYFDRQEATWRLQAQEEQFRLLFENNPHPMWVYDLETLQILAVNDTALEQYGYSREDFLARTMADLEVNQPRATLDSPQKARPTDHQDGIHQHRLKDGRVIQVEVSSRLIEFAGRSARLVLALDVTSRLQAEQALRASERRFRLLLRSVGEGVYGIDRDGRIAFANPAALSLLGWDEAELLGQHCHTAMHTHHGDGSSCAEQECPVLQTLRDGRVHRSAEEFFFRKDGSRFPLEYVCTPVRDQNEQIVGAVVAFTDISERRAAERERQELLLREQAARREADNASVYYRSLFEHAPGCYAVLRPDDYTILTVSEALLKATRTTREELIGKKPFEVFPDDPADPQANGVRNQTASLERVKATGRSDVMAVQRYPIRRPESEGGGFEERFWSCVNSPVFGPDGKLAFIISRVEDVTEYLQERQKSGQGDSAHRELASRAELLEADIVLRSHELKQVNEQLAHSQGLLRMASQISKMGAWRVLLPDFQVIWSEELYAIHEVAPDYVPSVETGLDFYVPEHRDLIRTALMRAAEQGIPFDVECRMLTARKREIWVRVIGEAVRNDRKEILLIQGALQDVTSIRQAEQSLRVSEERFRLLAKATNDAIWDWDIPANHLWWNEGLQTLFGYYLDEFSPTIEAWEQCIHPDDRERIVSGVYRAIEDGSTYWSGEYRFLCKDGKYAYVLDRGYIIRDQSGKAVRMIGGMTDLTEKKNLEMRLIQSQKMEAIGHLAGGVAHDFNNLLTVINGYCEILMTMLPENDRKRHMLAQVRDAGEHAANLTRQLLAFSRKQVLAPQVIDLNATVSNLQKMLQRLIGEDIRLTTVLHPGLKRVKVDPGQLEQVLLNLAVNARDAMPTGGQLLIETSNVQIGPQGVSEHPDVPPGDYVAVKVSDTGCGMPPEIQARIFEPFFTTKEVGKGTGLGLATVFGIVKQSNGYIEVNSKVGVGTQFQILFPAVEDKPRQPARLQSPVARGSETILLVEDEPNVRHIARMSLEAQGYRVLEAGSGSEAIDLFEATDEPIHLVITDVIMPEMSGRELSERLRQRSPEVKVLYMSGYTDDAIVRHGVIEEKELFLQKPFSPATLAHKVRSILDNL